jgi:hypothetical protein
MRVERLARRGTLAVTACSATTVAPLALLFASIEFATCITTAVVGTMSSATAVTKAAVTLLLFVGLFAPGSRLTRAALPRFGGALLLTRRLLLGAFLARLVTVPATMALAAAVVALVAARLTAFLTVLATALTIAPIASVTAVASTSTATATSTAAVLARLRALGGAMALLTAVEARGGAFAIASPALLAITAATAATAIT